jgi:hypothetical protein
MSDLHDIVLSEASGTKPNPQDLISALRGWVVYAQGPETVGLTGAQEQQLHAAILSGFDSSELRELVQFQMNERLERITSNGPLATVVLELIDWAGRQGRTEELVRAVQGARPDNRVIQSVAALLPGAVWTKAKSQQEIAKADEIRASTMQKLGILDDERVKLIRERDERAHEREMFELQTERLRAVVESLRVIQELGIKLSARTTRRIGAALAELAEPSHR